MKTKQKRVYHRKPKEPGKEIVKVDTLIMEGRPEIKTMPTDSNSLIAMAVDRNIDLDKLQRLIDMRDAEDKKICEKEFFLHFSAMQMDFIPVAKNNRVEKDGKKLYSYASLDDILKTYQPILSKHGFSYRWNGETMNEGKTIRMWCIISGYGHEIRGYKDIPVQAGTSFTNSVQQQGSATTYGKRYSFCDVLGIILEGEDTDGRGDDDPPKKPITKAPNPPAPEKQTTGNVRDVTPLQIDPLKAAADAHKEAYRKRLHEVASILLEPPFTEEDKKTSKDVFSEASKTQNIEALDKYERYLIEEVAFKRGYTKWDAVNRRLIKEGAK